MQSLSMSEHPLIINRCVPTPLLLLSRSQRGLYTFETSNALCMKRDKVSRNVHVPYSLKTRFKLTLTLEGWAEGILPVPK